MIKVKHRASSKSLPIFDKKIGGEIGKSSPLNGAEIFLSPKNAARYMDVSVKFVYELMQTGQLEIQPVGRRLKRIKKGALDNWLTAQAMKKL